MHAPRNTAHGMLMGILVHLDTPDHKSRVGSCSLG